MNSLSPAVQGARVDGGDGDGDGNGGGVNGDVDGDGDDPLSRSLSDPLAGMTVIDSLPLAEGVAEAGGESTAWELSSSSGDEDETNAYSAIR